jgi:uncharacterized protein YbaP (TraB family)
MKTARYFHQFAAKSCAFLSAAFIISAAPAFAYQQDHNQQSEIRYIDRSKGEQPTDGALLWRIEHPESSNIKSSYIFGTIHIDDERVMEIPDTLLHRLIAADTLMLELELNDGGSVDMLRKMLFTDGRDLTQVIGEQSFKDCRCHGTGTGNCQRTTFRL